MKSHKKTAFSSSIRAAFCAAAAVLLSGCLFPGGTRKTYLAEWRGAPPDSPGPAADQALLPALRIGPFVAIEPYASARMLVWEEATGRLHGTRRAQFAAPPAVTVQAAVLRAFAGSGAFESVSDASLAASGGAALRGCVECARLEKRADGTFAYAMRVSFGWRENASSPPRFAVCEASVPAASAKPSDQARAASAAAGEVAEKILSTLVR